MDKDFKVPEHQVYCLHCRVWFWFYRELHKHVHSVAMEFSGMEGENERFKRIADIGFVENRMH